MTLSFSLGSPTTGAHHLANAGRERKGMPCCDVY